MNTCGQCVWLWADDRCMRHQIVRRSDCPVHLAGIGPTLVMCQEFTEVATVQPRWFDELLRCVALSLREQDG